MPSTVFCHDILHWLLPPPEWKPKRERRRKPSNTALIKQARKAGERGRVSVTLPDGRTLTSERESVDAAATANPWDEVLKKNATH